MKKKKIIAKVTIVAIFIIVGIMFFRSTGFFSNVNLRHVKLKDFKNYLSTYGNKSAIVFILIYGLKPLVMIIPASILSVVSGLLYGSFYGTIYTMIGAFFDATTAFYMARFLGYDFINKIAKGKVKKLDNSIEEHGFKIMFLMRISVVFPYDPLSFAAGLSKMKYRDFILGTMLGILPEMFAYNYLGTNLENPFSKKTLIVILLVICIALIPIIKKKKNRKIHSNN